MDKIYFTKIRNVNSPVRAHKTDAGIDLFVPNDFPETVLKPNEDVLIPSGLKVDVPKGYAMVACNKSGIATKYKLGYGAQVVDEGYTGEVHIHVFNHGSTEVRVHPGMKIIQFLLLPVGYHEVQMIGESEYEYRTSESDRGEKGFGSSGI